MSSTFLATKSVRHIAVWTADYDQTLSYAVEGAHAPLCGRVSSRDYTSGTPWEGSDARTTRHQIAIARRPICRHCAREVSTLLLSLADDHDGNALELALRKIVDHDRAQAMFQAFAP